VGDVRGGEGVVAALGGVRGAREAGSDAEEGRTLEQSGRLLLLLPTAAVLVLWRSTV